MKSHPSSSIPSGAAERIISEDRPQCAGADCSERLQSEECTLGDVVVGIRWYDRGGRLVIEEPRDRAGRTHGVKLTWHDNGQLELAEPYHEGLIHGTARQWADDGRLIGTYTLTHGTGLDIWRNLRRDGTAYVSEVTTWVDGRWHGYQWLFDEDHVLWWERHFAHFKLHGIEREWNEHGGLRRDSPKYWIDGEQVRKRKYLRAVESRRDLPPYGAEDQERVRVFPPEVQRLVGGDARDREIRQK